VDKQDPRVGRGNIVLSWLKLFVNLMFMFADSTSSLFDERWVLAHPASIKTL